MSIKEDPRLLYNKLISEFGRRWLEGMVIPDAILNNLNNNFSLRDYQNRAFRCFVGYTQEEFEFKERPTHLLFNMATGSGKTLIMAGCILHLYSLGYRNFLFFSTSNPIIEKTKDNFLRTNSHKYLFHDIVEIGGKQVRIREVDTFDDSNQEDINIKFTTIQKLHRDLSVDGENKITLDSLGKYKIVLVGDEAHHFNAATNTQLSFQDLLKDDSNWESTIARILQSNAENMLLEYTATIDWDNEKIRDKYLSKCLVKYDLKEFREDGFSKEIKLFQSDTGIDKKDLMLQAIILNQFRQDIAINNKINLKPVILFKANRTIEESEQNFEQFQDMINNLSVEDILRIRKYAMKSDKAKFDANGEYKDINYLAKAFEYYERTDKSLDLLVSKLKLNFAANKCLNVNEYAFDGGKQAQKSFDKKYSETVIQEDILNSLENDNNEYRAIFAVNKLNEGWDVLNLFDIVRLYSTRSVVNNRAGASTIAEAQLIGRGARYWPFSITNTGDRYKRKFDDDLESPLRLLETLHYHSIYDSRYISELRAELIKSGAVADEKVVKTIKLKDEFIKNDLFTHGLVYVNDCRKTDYSEYRAWDDMPLVNGKTFTYEIYSGLTKQMQILESEVPVRDNMSIKTSKIISLESISNNIKRNAILTIPFFEFNNLKKYIKDISSIEDFIKLYLDKLEITIRGSKEDVESFVLEEQYKAVLELLLQIRMELKGLITDYRGTRDFRPVAIKKVFKSKELQFDKSNNRLNNAMIDFVKDRTWYVYDAVYGTSEEKSFIEMFDGFIGQLKQKYKDIKLIRNERDLSIFDFAKGRRFEPDFLLILKDKNNNKLNYQVFIEPKGAHLRDNPREKWKTDFLEAIRAQYENQIIEFNSDKKYRIIGLPFYSSSNEAMFRHTLKKSLLE